MRFETWLKKFKKDQTPIGDLARDFITSKYKSIEDSFSMYPPCSDAKETYQKAKNEYLIYLATELEKSMIALVELNKEHPILDAPSLHQLNLVRGKLGTFIKIVQNLENTDE